MTDWPAVLRADCQVPQGQSASALVTELLEALCSPDPVRRDDQAYTVLATWIMRGLLDGELADLGERVTGLLAHPELQARTFAALIVTSVLHRDTAADVLDAPTVLRWLDRFAGWWVAETDLRGWDDQLGWLHAAAHGADVIGAYAESPRLAAAELSRLLEITCARLLAPTGHIFAQQEDDRFALALATVLSRPELSAGQATAWLAAIQRYFESGEPGPVPAPAINAMRTLRGLYVMADRGFLRSQDSTEPILGPHRAEVMTAVGDLLHLAFPPQA